MTGLYLLRLAALVAVEHSALQPETLPHADEQHHQHQQHQPNQPHQMPPQHQQHQHQLKHQPQSSWTQQLQRPPSPHEVARKSPQELMQHWNISHPQSLLESCSASGCPLLPTHEWQRRQVARRGMWKAKQTARKLKASSVGVPVRTGTDFTGQIPWNDYVSDKLIHSESADTVTTVYVHGERESGTNFVEQLLKVNSDGASVEITSPVGYKHVIGPLDEHGKPRGEGELMCNEIKDSGSNSLWLVVTRNALDWAHGFQQHPWHSCYHCALDLKDFVTKPFGPKAGPPGTGERCDSFLDPNITYYYWHKDNKKGARYADNLMEARTWWMQSWLNAAECAGAQVQFVQYEELLGSDGWGFETVLQNLADGAPAKTNTTGPKLAPKLILQDDFPSAVTEFKGDSGAAAVDVGLLYNGSVYERRLRGEDTPEYDDETLQAMLDAMDMEVERRLGYNYTVPEAGRRRKRQLHKVQVKTISADLGTET